MVVKSMLQNSATPAYVAPTGVGTPDKTRISLSGVGIAHIDRALDLSAYTMPAGISFGRENPLTAGSYTETVWVHSMSPGAITYDIVLDPIQTVPGVTVSAPDSITVPGGGAASFDVTMTLDPSAMPVDDGFFSQTESDGHLWLVNQADEDDTVSLAYMAVVDPASNVSGEPFEGGADFTNTGPSDGWVEGFSLVGVGDDVDGVIGAQGVRMNDYGVDVVEFGLAGTMPWNTLSSLEIDIFLDVDEDGVDDFILVAADLGLLTGGDFTGTTVTGLFNLNTGDFPLEYYVLGDLNDHVLVLTVDAYGDYGFLADGDTTFNYTTAVFDLQTDALAGLQMGSVDLTKVLDGATSTLSETAPAGGGVMVDDLNPPDTTGDGSHHTLWLYSNNQVPNQFQIIDVPVVPVPEPVFEMDTVGAFDSGTWVLRDMYGDETSFTFGDAGDQPIVGDWDCDGVDTVGVFRDGMFALRNSNSAGAADLTFMAGDAGDVAVAGDWNGDGCSTVGLHRPSTGEVFIWNSAPGDGEVAPPADITYYFGDPDDKAFAGDFDGDGVDTIGLHRESTGFVYFRNSHTQGIADNEFYFGNPDDRLIAGDWGIVDGVDTPAVFRPSNTVWYFRHTNTQGIADSQFTWGTPAWMPVAGNFGLNGG